MWNINQLNLWAEWTNWFIGVDKVENKTGDWWVSQKQSNRKIVNFPGILELSPFLALLPPLWQRMALVRDLQGGTTLELLRDLVQGRPGFRDCRLQHHCDQFPNLWHQSLFWRLLLLQWKQRGMGGRRNWGWSRQRFETWWCSRLTRVETTSGRLAPLFTSRLLAQDSSLCPIKSTLTSSHQTLTSKTT